MIELKIYTWPSDVLSQVADEVSLPLSEDDKALIFAMHEKMAEADGAGLAATQCGVTKRIFVMNTGEIVRSFVNPVVVGREGTTSINEGCLSFPGLYQPVIRNETITVRYVDETGEERTETFDGLEAVCVQHEIDHLDGIVFLDRLSRADRRAAKSRYQSLRNRRG